MCGFGMRARVHALTYAPCSPSELPEIRYSFIHCITLRVCVSQCERHGLIFFFCDTKIACSWCLSKCVFVCQKVCAYANSLERPVQE